MYLEHFTAARDHLLELGQQPLLSTSGQITNNMIDEVDRRIGKRMPDDLRRFYIEMGDAFALVPDASPNSPLIGWGATWLEDYAIHNHTFSDQVEEEALGEINKSSPRVEPQLIREEAERRKGWIAFYGFTGGGDLLCLDDVGSVRFYEALYWRASPKTWDFLLAGSLMAFVEQWGRYCFVAPTTDWTTFCIGRTGTFDWSSEHFPVSPRY